MRAVRQLGNGILYGLVSVIIVVGGLSLALAESYTAPSPTPTTSLPAVPQTLTPTQTGPTTSPSSTPTSTATPQPPNNCPPPAGWILISVQPYDTIQTLAERYRVAPAQLVQANCLLTNNLEPGFNIYVPPPPASQPISCGAPLGWMRAYVVRPGDTLYHIAALYRTSSFELQRANCLFTTVITPGNILWVPNIPIFTPQAITPYFGAFTPSVEPQAPTQSQNPNFWFFLQHMFRWRHSQLNLPPSPNWIITASPTVAP